MPPFVRPRDLVADVARLRNNDVAVEVYLDELCHRIDSTDTSIGAFVDEPERRHRLRVDAAALRRRWPDPTDRPPLFGLPIAVKDVFHVSGLPTRAGSRLPAKVLAGAEARVVSILRELGALVLGKTVTAEFAFFAPGPTRNPHALDHSPGGSSSGSAAAVAAGMAPFALGTQTVGSVIRPASYCGVVGFKPTHGRVPTDGVIPNAPTFDTVGGFASNAAGLGLIAPHLYSGWAPTAAARPVLGIPTGPYLDQADTEMRASFEHAVDHLALTHYDIVEVPALADVAVVNARNDTINLYELGRVHAHWYAALADRYHDVTRLAIEAGLQIDAGDYERALVERGAFVASLANLMVAAGIDAWICPAATGPATLGLDTTGSPLMNLPWSQAGLPVVGLPSGTSGTGLPLGVQFVGRRGSDEQLIAWSADFESHLLR